LVNNFNFKFTNNFYLKFIHHLSHNTQHLFVSLQSMTMTITIDKSAGFCPGVKRAIRKAEMALEKNGEFHSLGSLLHNEQEMGRLGEKGLKVVGLDGIPDLGGRNILFRAHGEPPETYGLTKKNNVEVIDATCGVVRKLQQKVSAAAEEMEKVDGQVVIFGKPGHPEVIGLMGHTKGLGLVISSAQDLAKVDMEKPLRLFSQTTMDDVSFQLISDALQAQISSKSTSPDFVSYNTICHHVLNRAPQLIKFASEHEVIIFVSGRESSNGKKLFRVSSGVNPNTYFISDPKELDPDWFTNAATVGISGSASTPEWLMIEVAGKIEEMK